MKHVWPLSKRSGRSTRVNTIRILRRESKEFVGFFVESELAVEAVASLPA
jgi:hypothetical protein